MLRLAPGPDFGHVWISRKPRLLLSKSHEQNPCQASCMHVSLRENTLGIGHSPAVDDVCQKITPQNSRTRFCTYCLEFICKNGSGLEFTCPHSPPALPICLLYLFLSFCPPHSLFFFSSTLQLPPSLLLFR